MTNHNPFIARMTAAQLDELRTTSAAQFAARQQANKEYKEAMAAQAAERAAHIAQIDISPLSPAGILNAACAGWAFSPLAVKHYGSLSAWARRVEHENPPTGDSVSPFTLDQVAFAYALLAQERGSLTRQQALKCYAFNIIGAAALI